MKDTDSLSKLDKVAHKLFACVQGGGDASSVMEWYALNPCARDGWRRLARREIKYKAKAKREIAELDEFLNDANEELDEAKW
jgi:hypothetical protein